LAIYAFPKPPPAASRDVDPRRTYRFSEARQRHAIRCARLPHHGEYDCSVTEFYEERPTSPPGNRLRTLEARRALKMAGSAHAYARGSTVQFYQWLRTSALRQHPSSAAVFLNEPILFAEDVAAC
jgi:hypothetical protein